MYHSKMIMKMNKLKKIIYKCLPYAAGACAVAFACTIVWCVIALILDL